VTVMFTGAIVYGVHYTIPEYLCTFLITGGVSIFSLLKVKTQRNSYQTELLLNFIGGNFVQPPHEL